MKGFFESSGCPICKAIDHEMEEYFKWFELESYHEYASLKELYEHSCICERHTRRLVQLGEKLNNTFELVIEQELNFLNGLKALPMRKSAKILREQNLNCRFCLEEKRIEEHLIITFAKNPELVELYLDSPSILCKKHFILILEMLGNKQVRNKIIEKTRIFLNELYQTIQCYFHKLDYQSIEKPAEDERKVYKKALLFYSIHRRSNRK